MTAKLDDQTERAITGVAIAAVRQFRDKADRAETRAATTALRQRIRQIVEESRATAWTQGYDEAYERVLAGSPPSD